MYAIISAGNKQYRVSQGETIYIDKVNQEDGSTISFDVLMVENNGEIKVGNPTVAGATVEGKVVAQVKGEKINPICKVHGHLIHQGAVGIAQAASYACNRLWKTIGGIE